MEVDEKYDDVFLVVARSCKDIGNLLDVFFSFLRRKTDFFHILTDRDPSKGFLQGEAKKILLSTFDKHQQLYFKSPHLPSLISSTLLNTTDRQYITGSPNNGPNNSVYISFVPRHLYLNHDDVKRQVNAALDGKGKCVDVKFPNDSMDEGVYVLLDSFEAADDIIKGINEKRLNIWKQDNGSFQKLRASSETSSASYDKVPFDLYTCHSVPDDISKNSISEVSYTTEDLFPVKSSSHITTWNGGICDKYIWTQSILDITMEIPLPYPCRGSDLNVHINFTFLKVECRDKTILEGEFYERVTREDCMWNIEDKVKLIVSLQKQKECWWESVLKGDPTIDTTKVESIKKIEDYDSATQSHIRKIVYDESQKAMGKPTSDEQRKRDFLAKVWDTEGSPFKGTPFNPDAVNLQGGFPAL